MFEELEDEVVVEPSTLPGVPGKDMFESVRPYVDVLLLAVDSFETLLDCLLFLRLSSVLCFLDFLRSFFPDPPPALANPDPRRGVFLTTGLLL